MALSPDRPRTPVIGAWLEGWRRVFGAPALAGAVLLVTFLFALPMAIALNAMMAEHLGASLEADRAASTWNEDWATEFQQQAQGIGRTFTHEILDFGGTIKIISDIADRQPLNPAVASVVVAYLVFWLFVGGGIIDRLARGRPVRTAAFFAACGVYFIRFLRLAVVMAVVYGLLFWKVHPFLFGRVYGHFVRNMTTERPALDLRIALYTGFGLLLVLANLIFDYTKLRIVVEDRRSVVAALPATLRFLRRRPLRTLALYGLDVLVFLVIVRLWYDAAPSAQMSTWAAFLLTQVYLLCRVLARLAFIASECVFFQGELAHAGYTAASRQTWPESASAEAIRSVAAAGDTADARREQPVSPSVSPPR